MKRQHRNLLFCLLSFLLVTQCSFAQEVGKADTEKSLRVQLERTNFYLGEPIYADFEFTFPSTNEIPKISNVAVVKVTYNGKTREFRGLTIYVSTGAPQLLPSKNLKDLTNPVFGPAKPTDAKSLNSGMAVTEYTSLKSVEEINRVEEFFPQPGKYSIQFEVQGTKSDKIDLIIKEPEGLDKQAFDFLKKYDNALSFDWVWKESDGTTLLESFVSSFSASVYSESAIRYLGYLYKAKGDLDKAETEFEKIQFSTHKFVADEAVEAISEIKQQRAKSK
jgi:hypothetical protein